MSEFRQDLVSGDWIIMSPKRGGRPHDFKKQIKKRERSPKRSCPFENLESSGNAKPIFRIPDKGEWSTALIPNKYPALVHGDRCASELKNGPYRVMEGLGHHQLVVTRDHDANFAHLSPEKAKEVFEMFHRAYTDGCEDECLRYVSVFANWGPKAGASLYHPHYQILSLPIIPPDVHHSLEGSRNHFHENGDCVHCAMIDYETKEKSRIIFETEKAIAFAPFVSRDAYEVRIFPKPHYPYFERTDEEVISEVTSLLQKTLLRMGERLGDPDYNFFIHTSPTEHPEEYHHYHWHIEILPKITIDAGFELSTGIDIDAVLPEDVANLLR